MSGNERAAEKAVDAHPAVDRVRAPVGHASRLRTFVDRNLLGHAAIWAAGGHPHTVSRLAPEALVRITGGTVADFT